MYTNLEYEKAKHAIDLVKQGYNMEKAASTTGAKIELVNVMMSNRDVFTPETFTEPQIKDQREMICSVCPENKSNICLQCACPINIIVNMKFKSCPIGKW